MSDFIQQVKDLNDTNNTNDTKKDLNSEDGIRKLLRKAFPKNNFDIKPETDYISHEIENKDKHITLRLRNPFDKESFQYYYALFTCTNQDFRKGKSWDRIIELSVTGNKVSLGCYSRNGDILEKSSNSEIMQYVNWFKYRSKHTTVLSQISFFDQMDLDMTNIPKGILDLAKNEYDNSRE